MESYLLLNGKVVVSSITRKMIEFYQAAPSDLDGIIDQLRVTKGVEVAVFIYETDLHEFKVSLRSNGEVNVSKIAVFFGGGGHVRAAGYTMNGILYDVINNLMVHVDNLLKEIAGQTQ
jgi:phosphoesterase RecJ-like protein